MSLGAGLKSYPQVAESLGAGADRAVVRMRTAIVQEWTAVPQPVSPGLSHTESKERARSLGYHAAKASSVT